MACLTLSSGRALPCKKTVGGLKAVYFADFGSLGTVTKSGSEITAISAGDFYKFDINGTSSLETTINSSKENGSLFYTQTLNLTLEAMEVDPTYFVEATVIPALASATQILPNA